MPLRTKRLFYREGVGHKASCTKGAVPTRTMSTFMAGPIVGQGRLVETVNFARIGNAPSFEQADLTASGAVCAHFSARLAEMRSLSATPPNSLFQRLTPREVEIVLVVKGLTNAAIGKALWITQNSAKQALKRMFRKFGFFARTEMVAKQRERP